MKAPVSRLTHLLIWVAFAISSQRVIAEESHPGLGVESLYSEAVLAYNKQQSAEAIRILDEILKIKPNHVEALELKALTLKSTGDEKNSLETYKKLIQLKPEKERAPYYFESAVILNRQKKFPEAKADFEKALAGNFNPLPAHLFLGMIAFGGGDPAEAQGHFETVTKGGSDELALVAHYYLGLIHFKEGYAAGGTGELVKAREIAATLPDSQVAKDITAGSDKILEPFKNGQWFANITMMAEYDTNISEVPTGSAIPDVVAGAKTPKLTLSGGVGRMTSPLSTIQLVPSYRFNYNYNFNSDAKAYSFFTNTGSLYVNYKALSETTGGLKLEGSFTFQNQPKDPTDPNSSYTYSKYNFAGDIGPYIRTQLSPQTRLEWEAAFKPQTYYISDYLSGTDYETRGTIRYEAGKPYWNPGGHVVLERDNAQDPDWKFTSVGFGVFDVMRPTSKDTLTLETDYTIVDYSSSSAGRKDHDLTLHGSWLHPLSNNWSLLGDVAYTTNSSTEPDTYAYNRFVLGFGASKSF